MKLKTTIIIFVCLVLGNDTYAVENAYVNFGILSTHSVKILPDNKINPGKLKNEYLTTNQLLIGFGMYLSKNVFAEFNFQAGLRRDQKLAFAFLYDQYTLLPQVLLGYYREISNTCKISIAPYYSYLFQQQLIESNGLKSSYRFRAHISGISMGISPRITDHLRLHFRYNVQYELFPNKSNHGITVSEKYITSKSQIIMTYELSRI